MPPKLHTLPHTFPHRTVFVVSFVLCLCACASIVNAVLAWNNVLWGYYFGTGFWCGGIILFAGMFGIVASFVRNICSVKTFMIISIFGCLASLGMIALAAGGLDSDSGFYNGNNRGVLMTHVVHAVYLGLGLLQLTLCVLSDGICIYYLFIEKSAEIYRVKNFKTSRKGDSNIARESKNRSSTGSEVPLVARNSSRRKNNDDNNSPADKSGSNNNVGNAAEEDEPIRFNTTKSLDRQALRRQDNVTSPIRNPYIRSASFSTFGRGRVPERTSLIVHPTDDNTSLANTSASNIPDDLAENAYAHIPLFGPPVPIEDDDELPPYEFIDTKLLKRGKRRGLKRPKSEEIHPRSHPARRAHTTPVGGKRKLQKRMKSSHNQSEVPHGKIDNSCESDIGKQQRLSNIYDRSGERHSIKRLSKSADLLSVESDNNRYIPDEDHNAQTQGVAYRDFAQSSDMILIMDEQVPLRHKRSTQSQSLRVNRDKRLDRRRKALSAEVKLNKDQFLVHDSDYPYGFDSFDGTNPSWYAGNRIMPTKFSLRRPMRQNGMPYVNAPVPVKPIVTVPSVRRKAPPKPPRTHSVTTEDLRNDEKEINYEVEVENLFADINELNDADDVFSNQPFKVSTNIEPTSQGVSERRNVPNDIGANSLPQDKSVTSTYAVNITSTNAENVNKANIVEANKTVESKPIAYVSSTQSTPPDAKLDSGPLMKFQPQSTEVILDSGPVVKFVPPKPAPKPIGNISNPTSKQVCNIENKPNDSMVLPMSPVLRQPASFIADINLVKNNDGFNFQANKEGNSEQRNVIKLPETAKTLDNSTPTTKGTNVIYSQVVKTKECPVSPIASDSSLSPTSPTSPTTRMMKARRLLYSFTDKDLNVFDPVSTGRETEEVAEVVDTQTITHPVQSPNNVPKRPQTYNCQVSSSNNGAISNITVRSPPLSPLDIIPVDRIREITTNNPATTKKDLEDKYNKQNATGNLGGGSAISNITVRSPPLSATERILQRQNIMSDAQNDTTESNERPVILQPVMNSTNRHSYGARPKTKYHGLFGPLPPPKPAEKPVTVKPYHRKSDTKPVFDFDKMTVTPSKLSNRISEQPSSPLNKSVQSEPQPEITRHQVSLPSPLTASTLALMTASLPSTMSLSTATVSRNVQADPMVVNSLHLPMSSSTSYSSSRDVPVNRVQATPTMSTISSNSQGVRHLPQSQYSRQISGEPPRPVPVRDNPQPVAPLPNVNVVQRDNGDSTNKPLFSVVL